MRHPDNRQADAKIIGFPKVDLPSALSARPDVPSCSDAAALETVKRVLRQSGYFEHSAQWVTTELARDILRAISLSDS